MKKPVLLLVISMMVATFGFSQVLGPPDYNAADRNDGTPVLKPLKADPPPVNDKYNSLSANCAVTGTCVIDYPRPVENPYIKTTSPMLLTQAQINVQPLPVVYLNNDAKESADKPYRCVIVDLTSESPSTVRSHPRMFCTAADNGGVGY